MALHTQLKERNELWIDAKYLLESLHLGLVSVLLEYNELALMMHVLMDYFLARLSRSQVEIKH